MSTHTCTDTNNPELLKSESPELTPRVGRLILLTHLPDVCFSLPPSSHPPAFLCTHSLPPSLPPQTAVGIRRQLDLSATWVWATSASLQATRLVWMRESNRHPWAGTGSV